MPSLRYGSNGFYTMNTGIADSQSSTAGGKIVTLGTDTPMQLDCGVELGPYTVAYQTYGTLNADRSNAILVTHALT